MDKDTLYEEAVSLLAKRDYASGEIRRVLSRQADEACVEQVMTQLLSHHYLDDSRLIEREIEKRMNKRYGPSRIKQELRQKGLDPLLIEQALEDKDVDWFEVCQQAKEKKFGETLPQDSKEKAKMVRYLQYRGHSMPAIMESLS